MRFGILKCKTYFGRNHDRFFFFKIGIFPLNMRDITIYVARWWERYLLKRSLIKHTCSWRVNEHWTDKQKYFYLYLYVVSTLQDKTFCNSFICKSLVFTRISNFFASHMFIVAKIPSFVHLNNKPIKNPWLRPLLLPLIECFLNFVMNILLDSILASSIKIFLDQNENIS